MSGIRAFVAVRLSSEVLAQVHTMLSALQPIEPNLKWVTCVNLHFTLAFLGNVSETKIPDIQAVCYTVAAQHPVFTLQLSRLGVFPLKGQPRILWLSITQGIESMQALQNTLVTNLQAMGCALENRLFVPHLTLGRVQNGKTIHAWKTLEKVALPKFDVMPVASLELMRSNLDSSGPCYSVLGSCPLLVPSNGSV